MAGKEVSHTPGKPGQPPHAPTEKQRGEVLGLASAGVPHRFICRLIGISDVTLRKHYEPELAKGFSRCIAEACMKRAAAVRRGEAWAICFTLKILPEFREVFQMLPPDNPDPATLQPVPLDDPQSAARAYMDMLKAPAVESPPVAPAGKTTH